MHLTLEAPLVTCKTEEAFPSWSLPLGLNLLRAMLNVLKVFLAECCFLLMQLQNKSAAKWLDLLPSDKNITMKAARQAGCGAKPEGE